MCRNLWQISLFYTNWSIEWVLNICIHPIVCIRKGRCLFLTWILAKLSMHSICLLTLKQIHTVRHMYFIWRIERNGNSNLNFITMMILDWFPHWVYLLFNRHVVHWILICTIAVVVVVVSLFCFFILLSFKFLCAIFFVVRLLFRYVWNRYAGPAYDNFNIYFMLSKSEIWMESKRNEYFIIVFGLEAQVYF